MVFREEQGVGGNRRVLGCRSKIERGTSGSPKQTCLHQPNSHTTIHSPTVRYHDLTLPPPYTINNENTGKFTTGVLVGTQKRPAIGTMDQACPPLVPTQAMHGVTLRAMPDKRTRVWSVPLQLIQHTPLFSL
eukprot:1158728-Pelagomonas_calceolata.AAC.8